MKRVTKTLLAILPLLAGLLFTACEPLSKQLIAAVEDDYSPVIIVDTPTAGGTYYSTIDVSGHVNDDSLVSGDDIGILSSLSFEIASDLAHRGRITISSGGDATKDTGYGNVDIAFNPADRSFSFSVPTSDLGFPPQILYLRITAVDFNGNESVELIQLIRSEGPFVNLESPASDDLSYVKGGSFTVKGEVADSNQHFIEATAAGDPISADEVASVKIEILALGISAEIDIDGGETSADIFPRTGSFQYDAGSREFNCFVDLVSSDDGVTSLTIRVTATDKNGNSQVVTHSMTQIQEAGPVLYFYSPFTAGTYYYSGNPATAAQPILWVNGSSRTRYDSLICDGWVYSLLSGRLVETATLQFTSGGFNQNYNIKTSYIEYRDPLIWGRDFYHYRYTLAGSTFQSFAGNGTAEITLTAVDDTPDALTSTESWPIFEDSDGPVFSSEDLVTSTGTSYIGQSGSIDLSFNVADGSFETGLDPTSLSGSVAGIALMSGDFSDDGGGDYSVSVNLSAATQSTGVLDIAINAADYMGNPSSLDENDFTSVTFLSGVPTLTELSIAADVAPSDYAKPGDWVTLTVTASQDLKPSALVATIAGQTTTISGSGSTLTARAQIPGGYTTTPVEFDVTAFENMVGTAGTPPADLYTIFTGSDVTLIKDPPSIIEVSVVADVAPTDAAKPGDSITMTVKADQALDPAALDVEIAGVTATISGTGSTLTAQATIPGSYSTNPVGYVINSFKNIVGAAGTVPTPLSSVVTSPDITFYKNPPDLTTLTVTTAAGADRYAVTDEAIIVSLVSDQPLDHAPTVDIGGNSVVATGSGTNWSASTSNPSDGEGTVSLEVSDVVNIVGEASSPATFTTVTSGDNVLFYPGPPTLTGVSMTLVEVGGGSHPDAGDIVTLDFSVANGRVLQSNPTVMFSLGAGVRDIGTSAPDYKYEYTLTAGDLPLDDPVSYTIVFTDAAGQAGVQVTGSVDLTP
jgi:hypothetical protein